MSFTVTEKAMRPASSAHQCFYCNQPIGADHNADCVLVRKRVRVNFILKASYEVTVPNEWDGGNVNFHRNKGSWCANNALDELSGILDEAGDSLCLCNYARFEYVADTGTAFLDEVIGGNASGLKEYQEIE